MKLISKIMEIYCIADDFCKEYELGLNKKALSLSNPSPNTPKTRNRKGRMSDAKKMSFPTYFHIPDLWNVCHEWRFHFCPSLN